MHFEDERPHPKQLPGQGSLFLWLVSPSALLPSPEILEFLSHFPSFPGTSSPPSCGLPHTKHAPLRLPHRWPQSPYAAVTHPRCSKSKELQSEGRLKPRPWARPLRGQLATPPYPESPSDPSCPPASLPSCWTTRMSRDLLTPTVELGPCLASASDRGPSRQPQLPTTLCTSYPAGIGLEPCPALPHS